MNALDARNKLSEIQARLAALQALFMYDQNDKQFGQTECFGIDLTIQTIVDDLGSIDDAIKGAVKASNQG